MKISFLCAQTRIQRLKDVGRSKVIDMRLQSQETKKKVEQQKKKKKSNTQECDAAHPQKRNEHQLETMKDLMKEGRTETFRESFLCMMGGGGGAAAALEP